jgi:Ca2+-binding EF-hand superfamily protein
MKAAFALLTFVLAVHALDKNPKVVEDRTFTEKSPDGQNIQYHYERKEHSDGTTEIAVGSVDLMDTAEDMAESMADIPAKDVKSKDDTTKVLGETVFKSGVEDMEELEAEDPFLEQPIEDLEKESTGLTAAEKAGVEEVEKELKAADIQFEEEEGKDAATEAVFASRNQDMKELDENADGVLDTKEISDEIKKDMKEADEVSMLQQMKDETPALKHLIKIFDKDGDGELTMQELFGRESPENQKKYGEQFKLADQNEDGKLDAEELFDLHNMVWMKHWIAPQAFFKLKAKDHINFMDTNHDGGVDWQEFASFMKPHIEEAIKEGHLGEGLAEGTGDKAGQMVGADTGKTAAESLTDHLKRFKELFNEADLNHDGKLDEAEMEENLKDRENWMALAAAQGVVSLADDNKDSALSLNEVIKNADKFGAKTEDFFEDKDLLDVEGDGDGGDASSTTSTKDDAFVKKSLRGGD